MGKIKTCTKCGKELLEENFSKGRNQCKECRSEYIKSYSKEYDQKNKEAIADYGRARYEANPEKYSAAARARYLANPEKYIVASSAWYEANTEKRKAYCEANTEKRKAWRKANPERVNAASKKWYENNIEKVKITSKMWRETNAGRTSTRNKAWYEANTEKAKSATKVWQKSNPEKTRQYKHRRRAAKRSLLSTLTVTQWEETKLCFKNACCYCGKEEPLKQEHFLALSKGGEYSRDNILPACGNCNSSKGSKDFAVWYPKSRNYSKKREQRILDFLNYKNGIQQLSISL